MEEGSVQADNLAMEAKLKTNDPQKAQVPPKPPQLAKNLVTTAATDPTEMLSSLTSWNNPKHLKSQDGTTYLRRPCSNDEHSQIYTTFCCIDPPINGNSSLIPPCPIQRGFY
jgi:hypothetical protein